jgi:hypothetical protein
VIRSTVVLGLLLVVAACVPSAVSAQKPRCTFSQHDSAWTARAIEGWTRQSRTLLARDVRRFPQLVLFDTTCRYTLVPSPSRGGRAGFAAARRHFTVQGTRHSGELLLPDGARLPARLTSFAAPLPSGGMFFVMALPSVWRASDRDPTGDGRLASAVFIHEFTHTQSPALGARVDSLVKHGLPADVSDDVIQERFGERPGFRERFDAERELLFRAAAAPSDSESKALAERASSLIDARRRDFFVGTDAPYAEAEDLFLTMEGLAQWLAYRWLVDPRGGAMPAAEALPFMRRGGRRWSQDEGLALLLVLERLAPSAARGMLDGSPVTALEALREAVRPVRGAGAQPTAACDGGWARRPGRARDDAAAA